MIDEEAHEFLTGVQAICAHATYSELLPKIIGIGAPGLVPGGMKGQRHIHCSSVLPDERNPNAPVAGFRRKGVDVVIALDADLLRRHNVRSYRSAAGVVLIPQTVSVDYISRIQVLPAGLTIYNKRVESRRWTHTT